MAKYKLDCEYLINRNMFSRYDDIVRIRIIEITKTCYRVHWLESDVKTYEKISRLDSDFILEEELQPLFNINDLLNGDKTKEKSNKPL